MRDLSRVAAKYSGDLAVYAQYTTDVQGGEYNLNREIGRMLVQ